MANVKISELNPLLTVQDADVLPIVDNGVTKKVTAAILQSYTQGNSVLLTGAQTIAGIKTFTSQLASSVATGTAPFSVASTTKVTNLNADLLDGLSSADFQATLSGTGIVKSTSGTISYLTDNSSNWNTAYNDKINSAAVTGSGTNTLTLTQQDAGTITATWVNGTLIREIRNNTGATLTKGTIVYISGATGNKPTVSKAIATGDSTSAQTFGFIQEDIANNANGYVVVVGDLTGVDTSAFNEGDQLYLSSTTAGAFTSTKQYAPAHLVYVGIVTRSHPTLGQIEVNIQNGYEMDELHNVSAQNPSNGDILQFVTSTGLWTKVAGSTTNISEGTNLYYTAARFNSAFAGKTTTDLTEGTNLYFTNARARGAISLTTSGTSGAATYNSSTGVLNIPNYADTDTGITSLNGLTALTQTFAVGTSGTDFGISSSTSTHTFNLPTASATNRGALSSADWTTFNNKQNALTNPITGTGTTNYLPKFTGATALGNSTFFDNGGGDAGVVNATYSKLYIKGSGTDDTGGGVLNFSNQTKDFAQITGETESVGNALMIFRSLTSNVISEKMRITSAGNVGIGTSSPAYKFEVSDGTRTAVINPNASLDGIFLGVKENKPLVFGTNDNERMRITSAGNVGIGTTAPSRLLNISGAGTDGTQLQINGTQDSAGIKLIPTTGDNWEIQANTSSEFFIYNRTDAAYRFMIANTGNCLIGTTTDAGYKLDVNGTARFAGDVILTKSGTSTLTIKGNAITGFDLQNDTSGVYLWNRDATPIYFGTNATQRLIISATGAATFSSSVTATQLKAANPSECSIEINCTTGSGTAWRFNSYNNGNLYLQSDAGTLNKGIFDYTTGVYTPLSDVNKKKDFEDSTIGLKEVLGLKPTLYRMKTDNESAPKNLGFIAQEVKEFIPQAYVESGEEDNKFIGIEQQLKQLRTLCLEPDISTYKEEPKVIEGEPGQKIVTTLPEVKKDIDTFTKTIACPSCFKQTYNTQAEKGFCKCHSCSAMFAAGSKLFFKP